ncbi:succinate dehydrogenase iron-sulfur subunit [Lentibacillus sp. CBA3610]|uniref:succinate dehydrogenase iron-sulfur subunit n=1 Tax=Lentibacillus sp. CBA3610 TaxID=2518176 RepID=UPI00159606B3|nr:succinate dehydrogenase iron-sulfur subunit [Lentibacillus sp. CBA3610]QKY69608.1 succinate dehydrogenase iron-sulfur subunit [Lentibacillus sp. CBA3610]
MAEQSTVTFVITRQDSPDASPYKETFEIPYKTNMNVISGLMEIQRNPVNADGENTSPVQWDMNCLEEVCGACSMVINGTARQSCAALVDDLEQPIHLEPMSTFPVIRDLFVDREQMFDALKQVKAWIPIDGTHDLGPGPRMPEKKRQWAYELSKCMSCGVCLEACPNVNDKSDFIGRACPQSAFVQCPSTGEMNASERLDGLMKMEASQAAANAQNCVQVCPKGIPLTTSIAAMNRATNIQAFKNFFGSDEAH